MPLPERRGRAGVSGSGGSESEPVITLTRLRTRRNASTNGLLTRPAYLSGSSRVLPAAIGNCRMGSSSSVGEEASLSGDLGVEYEDAGEEGVERIRWKKCQRPDLDKPGKTIS